MPGCSTHSGCKLPLKDKSGVNMINDKMQDNTAMNGISYFFLLLFTLSL